LEDAATPSSVAAPLHPPHRLAAVTGIGAVALLILAAALRLYGARGALWLDEIWSLKLIQRSRNGTISSGASPSTTTTTSTRSISIWSARTRRSWRSAVSRSAGRPDGCGSRLGDAAIRSAGVLSAMALFAVSYPMVNYGSEARGIRE